MFIKSLSLRNFKTIKEADFPFKKGVICFTGNNGEGKSTVLHAILLMLFNTTYEGTLKDSIRWGEKEFSLDMEFEHEGHSYTESLVYSITKGSSRTLTDLNTGEVFSGASASSQLARIIDPEQARAAIVSMENEQNLVTTTPSQRREYLKKIYSLEFKEELNKINQDLTDLDNEIVKLQGKKELLEESSYPLKEEKELPDKSVYEEAKKKLDSLDMKMKNLMSDKEKLMELEREKSSIDISLLKSNQQIEGAERGIEIRNNEINTLREGIALLEKINYDTLETDELNSAIKEHQEKVESLNSKIEEDERELSKIPETLSRVSRLKLEELNSKKAELSHAIRESTEKLQVLRQGKCPTCGRDISPEEAEKERVRLTELQQEEQEVLEAQRTEQKRVDDLTAENERIKNDRAYWTSSKTKHLNEINSLDSAFSMTKENIALKYKADRAKTEGDIKTYQSQILASETAIKSFEETQRIYSEQIEEYNKRKESIGKQISAYVNLQDTIDRINLERKEPACIVSNYDDAVAYNNSVKVYNEEMLRKEEERNKQIKEITDSLDSLNTRKSMITVAKGMVQREFPSFVISRMVQSLSDYVNEFLDKVYPKYQISIEEAKNSLNILYGEYKTDVKMASGFEKSAFSLAYMYALGKIQAYGLLICDEGDATASDENSAKFYRMLGRSTDWLEQIMCITHKEEIKELLRNDFHAQVFTVENGVYREEVA